MTKQFIANIDKRNIPRLHKAAKSLGLQVELGKEMLFTLNGLHEHMFHPIFCRSTDDGVILMDKYLHMAIEQNAQNSLKTDSIPQRYWCNTHIPQEGLCF